MKWRTILAVGAVLLMLFLQFRQPGAAYACLGQNPGLEAEFDAADAVFQGEVVETNRIDEYQVDVTFDVSRGWKGSSKTMIIRQDGPGSCNYYPFVKGREYIVFATDNWPARSPSALYASLCGYTDEVSDRILAELTLIQPELQPLTGPGAFNPDDFLKWWFAMLVAGALAAAIWRWRRFRPD